MVSQISTKRASANTFVGNWNKNAPVFEDGLVKAMPDNVPLPLQDFDPEKILGNPICKWHLKSVTIEQAEKLFEYLSDKPVFLSSTEAKLISREASFSVFEYNIYPSDPIAMYGKSNVKEKMKEEFFEIATLSKKEEYPILFHIWLDEIKE